MPLVAEVGFVVSNDPGRSAHGVSDIVSVSLGGRDFLIVGSESHSRFSVWDLGGAAPVAVSSVTYSADSGTNVLSDLALVERDDGLQVMTLGRYDDNIALYDLADDGTLTFAEALSDARLDRPYVAAVGYNWDHVMLYTAHFGQESFQAVRLNDDDSLTFRQTFNNTWAPINNVTAIETATLHGQAWMFAASGYDAGVTSYIVHVDGNATGQFRHFPNTASGFSGITDLAAVQHGSRAFLVVGASETDSLTVLRISAGGRMREVDHLIDTRHTRFGSVQDLEVVEADGRVFVIAAGGDDGVAILELTYRGRLVHLLSVEDTFETTLNNVTSLDVRMEGSTAHIFAGSSGDHGVTELIVDLAATGADLRGGAVPDEITGTGGDDVIWGMGRSDVLNGRGGDDWLIDGRGRDTMRGGSGADVFEFVEDGRSDFLLDFQFGEDRIDLSAFDHLYHFSDLTIGPRLRGGAILVGEEVIRLRSSDGTPIDTSQFTQDDFIFG